MRTLFDKLGPLDTGGAPAWDPDFNSADLPMMMRIADLPPRYRKHFSAVVA